MIVDTDLAMAIVRAAEDDGADLLVVGNMGMSGRREFLLSNVPNRVSQRAVLGADREHRRRRPRRPGTRL